MVTSASNVSALLARWGTGDRSALDQAIAPLYDQLREVARARLRRAPSGRTLQTTSLVHEAFLRLAAREPAVVADRAHFLALAAQVMRHVIVDHARARLAAKREGRAVHATLADDDLWVSDRDAQEYSAVHEVLERLQAADPRRSAILEQRYFGGYSLEEISEAMGVSLATVKRELRAARAWLGAELQRDMD